MRAHLLLATVLLLPALAPSSAPLLGAVEILLHRAFLRGITRCNFTYKYGQF
jgi:hypothetical protein